MTGVTTIEDLDSDPDAVRMLYGWLANWATTHDGHRQPPPFENMPPTPHPIGMVDALEDAGFVIVRKGTAAG